MNTPYPLSTMLLITICGRERHTAADVDQMDVFPYRHIGVISCEIAQF